MGKDSSGVTANFVIARATPANADELALLVGDLLTEILHAIEVPAFANKFSETAATRRGFLVDDDYVVFIARDEHGGAVAFVSVYESDVVRVNGAVGTIAELYVRPEYRRSGLGSRLIAQVKSYAGERGWKRLEVTTQPQAEYLQTLPLYQRLGFVDEGGRKLALALGENSTRGSI